MRQYLSQLTCAIAMIPVSTLFIAYCHYDMHTVKVTAVIWMAAGLMALLLKRVMVQR